MADSIATIATLPEAAEKAGVEYRTLHSWVERGLLKLSRPPAGTGHPALLAETEVKLCAMLGRLRRAGCELPILEAALRSIGTQSDPEAVNLLLDGDISIRCWLDERTTKDDDAPRLDSMGELDGTWR